MVSTIPIEESPSKSCVTPSTSLSALDVEQERGEDGGDGVFVLDCVEDDEESEFSWGSSFFFDLECTFLKPGWETFGFGFSFCGEVVHDLGLKHLMVALGWHTRAAREAAIKHLSTICGLFVRVIFLTELH